MTLPTLPRETLERFWRGEPGEEPLGPFAVPAVPRPERRKPERGSDYNRLKCREWYLRNRERELERAKARYAARRKP